MDSNVVFVVLLTGVLLISELELVAVDTPMVFDASFLSVALCVELIELVVLVCEIMLDEFLYNTSFVAFSFETLFNSSLLTY